MNTQDRLIEALQKQFPEDSQAALARRCGLSVQRFNNYVQGIRTMDVDAVIGCAQALGWDIRATVAAHEIETAPTPRVKALWKAVAGGAMALVLGVGLALPAHAQAVETGYSSDSVYIMRNSILRRLRWVWLWITSCLPQRPPRKDEMQA